MTMRGRTRVRRLCTSVMKYFSIASVISKLAITPSFIGRIATMLPGVRPSIRLAAMPTANTCLESRCTATTDGSRNTTPFPATYTRVLAVPRSIARSLEKSPYSELSTNASASLARVRAVVVSAWCPPTITRNIVLDNANMRDDLAAWQESVVAKFAAFSRMNSRDRAQHSGGHVVPPVGEAYVAMDAKRPDLG